MTDLAVGINLLWLVPGAVGGSEQSTIATLRGLLDGPHGLHLELFVNQTFADAHEELAAAATTHVASIDGRSRVRRILAEDTWLVGPTAGLDVVHHAGGTVPLRRSAPAVLTLHDLQPLEASATHPWLKRAYLGASIPRSVRASRRIAVPSEFVRDTVLQRFGVAPDRVVVIPHAVPVRPSPAPRDEVVERYRLTGPVVLYAAVTYPHKEHATLLSAFEQVLDRHPDAVLVLPGGTGSSEAAVRAQVEGSDALRRQVRRPGRIPEADVAALLEIAEVAAVPSRYEGFGLPAVEAMAVGTPVIAADATALPEVLGEAGRLVPVGQVEAWRTALDELLGDAGERERLGAAGRARAAAYTPRANAEGFARLYREAAEAR